MISWFCFFVLNYKFIMAYINAHVFAFFFSSKKIAKYARVLVILILCPSVSSTFYYIIYFEKLKGVGQIYWYPKCLKSLLKNYINLCSIYPNEVNAIRC